MKSMKKVVVSLCLVVMMVSAFASSAFANGSQGNVELLRATFYHYIYGIVEFSGEVEVANLGYQKNVTIHYTTGNGQWYDTPATYLEATDSTHEKWTFNIGTNAYSQAHPELKTASYIQFAIKYEVNGQTYWNNNNGQNFTINSYNSYSIILDKPNVLKAYSSLYGTTFSGALDLKNLGYAKTVQIHYTTDNWQTTSIGNAIFSQSVNPAGAVERWSFNIPVSSSVNQIKYAIKYEVNGQTYWDNNYGKNYTENR